MAPFVRKVRTASGATAVQIAERVDRRDKVLEHLGSAHSAQELEALLLVADGRLHAGQDQLDFGDQGSRSGANLTASGSRSRVLWQVLEDAYAFVGFDKLADEAFKQLVLAMSWSRRRSWTRFGSWPSSGSRRRIATHLPRACNGARLARIGISLSMTGAAALLVTDKPIRRYVASARI